MFGISREVYMEGLKAIRRVVSPGGTADGMGGADLKERAGVCGRVSLDEWKEWGRVGQGM